MNVVEKIRRIFGKEPLFSRDDVSRLQKLPKERARGEFLDRLYEQGVKRAGNFVNGELKRPDSPYRGVPPAVFFEEMQAVTFWLIGKEVAGGNSEALDGLHHRYFQSSGGHGISNDQKKNALMKKYTQYDDTWNDETGHFDEFGLCVVNNIFGKEESSRTRERTFWIIQYADEMVKVFSRCRKMWKQMVS